VSDVLKHQSLPPPSQEIVLAIETSNPSAWETTHRTGPGVALGRWCPNLRTNSDTTPSVEILAHESIDPRLVHEDRLMAAVERACARAHVRPRELGRIAVSVGPGGYTTVRLAVTVAKMIAEVTGARCVAVPTALVAWWEWKHHADAAVNTTKPIAVALASKGDTAWITIVENGRAVREGLWAVDQFQRVASEFQIHTLLADRFVPAPIRSTTPQVEPLLLGPIGCLHAGLEGAGVEPAQLVPVYPREPEAVRKWRELRPGPTSTPNG
jgi:tRNA A37 threonylcarbamoyladenosine modification protein TsaB